MVLIVVSSTQVYLNTLKSKLSSKKHQNKCDWEKTPRPSFLQSMKPLSSLMKFVVVPKKQLQN